MFMPKAKWSYEGEDKVMYSKQRHYSVALLCDGHGGDYVASYVKNNFMRTYRECAGLTIPPEIAVRDTFNKLASSMSDMNEGTTVVGAIIAQDSVVVFNLGDSRCYGMRTDGTITRLTRDHTLQDPRECKRLKLPPPHPGKDRRLGGVLAMTRTIGDADVKGVSSVPDIRTYPRSKFDKLILVSDGVYTCLGTSGIKRAMGFDSINDNVRLLIHGSDMSDDRSALVVKL